MKPIEIYDSVVPNRSSVLAEVIAVLKEAGGRYAVTFDLAINGMLTRYSRRMQR
jgi:hypothetical protein